MMKKISRGARLTALSHQLPQSMFQQRPQQLSIVPPVALASSSHLADSRQERLRQTVEQAFPHATIIFRPSAAPHFESTTVLLNELQKAVDDSIHGEELAKQNFHAKAMLLGPAAPCDLSLQNLVHNWLYVAMKRSGGQRQELLLFPSTFSDKSTNSKGIWLGADLTIFLGGYEPEDLKKATLVEQLVTTIPDLYFLEDHVGKRPRDPFGGKRSPRYCQDILREQTLANKLCKLDNDTLEISLPDKSANFARERKVAFVTFGSPELFPSKLNILDSESKRCGLRTGFGFSEAVLKDRLPLFLVQAALLLEDWGKSWSAETRKRPLIGLPPHVAQGNCRDRVGETAAGCANQRCSSTNCKRDRFPAMPSGATCAQRNSWRGRSLQGRRCIGCC